MAACSSVDFNHFIGDCLLDEKQFENIYSWFPTAPQCVQAFDLPLILMALYHLNATNRCYQPESGQGGLASFAKLLKFNILCFDSNLKRITKNNKLCFETPIEKYLHVNQTLDPFANLFLISRSAIKDKHYMTALKVHQWCHILTIFTEPDATVEKTPFDHWLQELPSYKEIYHATSTTSDNKRHHCIVLENTELHAVAPIDLADIPIEIDISLFDEEAVLVEREDIDAPSLEELVSNTALAPNEASGGFFSRMSSYFF